MNVNGVRTTPPRVNEQQVLRINAGQRSSSNPPPRQQLINENLNENNSNNNINYSNNNLNNLNNNLNNSNNNLNNNLNNLNNSNLNNSNNHHDYFEIEYVQSEVRTKNKDLEVETLRSGEKKLNVKENRSAVNDGLGPGQNQGLGPGPGQGQGQGQGASQGQGQGQSLSPDTAKSKSSPKTIKSTSNSPISPTLVSEERPLKEERAVKSKYSHRSLSYMMDEMSMITAMTDENILAAKNMSVSNNQKGS